MRDMRTIHLSHVSLVGALLALVACAPSPDGAPSPASPVEAVGARPIIGKLATRDAVLSFHAGAEGPRFSVADATGATIARDVTLDDLRTRFPDLHDAYRSSTASTGTYLDATYRPAVHADAVGDDARAGR